VALAAERGAQHPVDRIGRDSHQRQQQEALDTPDGAVSEGSGAVHAAATVAHAVLLGMRRTSRRLLRISHSSGTAAATILILQPVSRFVARFEYKYLVAVACVVGLFMELLDSTIVSVALPRLGEEFHADTAMLEWVITGYLLSLAVWIPASGWIGDRFGTKRTFLFATATFVVGSALCGRAWSIESLAFFRVLQGIGGGMMTPVGTALLFRAFPVHERPKASAMLSLPAQLAPMLGPVVGGVLVDRVSWRWIFYVNLPFGVLGFLIALLVLKEHREPDAGRFDPAGFILSGAGLAGILFAFSRAPGDGWLAPQVLGPGLGGLACFGLLVLAGKFNPTPMLDLALFRNRMFRMANVINFLNVPALMGTLFLAPLFLQQYIGISALDSGLTTFPGGIAVMATLPFATRLHNRWGARPVIVLATSGLAAASGLLLLVDASTNLWWVRSIMLVRGVFIAFSIVSLQSAAFSTITREKTGRASSLFSAQRQTATAFAVAVLATVLSLRTQALTPPGATGRDPAAVHALLLAFHDAFGVVVLAGLAAALLALRLGEPKSRPAPEPAATLAEAAVAG
jgi:EmrB/QacA subfamily drug resistance transporter